MRQPNGPIDHVLVGKGARPLDRFQVSSRDTYNFGVRTSIAIGLVAALIAASGAFVGHAAVGLAFAGLFAGWSLSGSV